MAQVSHNQRLFLLARRGESKDPVRPEHSASGSQPGTDRLYWDIGRQSDARHGAAIAERLERPEARRTGNSGPQDLVHYLRAAPKALFHLYRENAKVQPLVAQIAQVAQSGHSAAAVDSLEREFYLRATRRSGWSCSFTRSTTGLPEIADWVRPTSTRHYSRIARSKAGAEGRIHFLELGQLHSERELERAADQPSRGLLARDGRNVHLHGQPIPPGG